MPGHGAPAFFLVAVIIAFSVGVAGLWYFGFLSPPGDQIPGLSVCPYETINGSPSCLVIKDLSFDFSTGFFSMDFEFDEPVCSTCTGNTGQLDILLNGNIVWRSFGPGNHTLVTSNIHNDAGGTFGLIEFWVTEDRTKGQNRIYVNASRGILTISDQFASGELP